MNTLDMPMNYVPALEEQDAVGKESLPVDLMALIDDCSADWANDDGEDLLAALGGESFEQALEDGVTLLDGGCSLIEEELLEGFVTEEITASCAAVKPDPKPANAAVDELTEPSKPRRQMESFDRPALSPFPVAAAQQCDVAAWHPGEDIWLKFEFPTDVAAEKKDGIPEIDWDTELAYEEPVPEASKKNGCVKEERDIMWSPQNPVELLHRMKPLPTPAQLRRKLMAEDVKTQSRNVAHAPTIITPDNTLLLANRSTTVPAASAMKARPMRSLLNTQKQQQYVVKTSSRSLLLPTTRAKLPTVAATSAHGSQTVAKPTAASVHVPSVKSSAKTKSNLMSVPDDEGTASSRSPRPETPQSIAESEEDEAPVFRHNTIDTIFNSTLNDASASVVYLTPSDSSGSPKSTICDDDEEDDDEEFESEQSNLRSPPESVIREERPARTVLPYISDHSYHLSKSSVRTDNLGVQTPSDSEEEIDVVSVAGDKSGARLPNNPSARDRRQIQLKVATAIQRNSGRQQPADQHQRQLLVESHSAGKKRPTPASGRGGPAKRARQATCPGQQGRGKAGGPGRGRRRVNSDEEPDPCEKRSMHNSMERQRRIDLRNLVEKLRQLVPATADNKRAAKVVILREAAQFCRIHTPLYEQREKLIAELRERQAALMARLSLLRTQVAAARLQSEDYTCEQIKEEPVIKEEQEEFEQYEDADD